MATIIGGILLLGSITGLILCAVHGSSILVFFLLFLALLVGGVLVFDNGSEKGLKFPDLHTRFDIRRGVYQVRKARMQADRGEITEQEAENLKKEYQQKYGLGKD